VLDFIVTVRELIRKGFQLEHRGQVFSSVRFLFLVRRQNYHRHERLVSKIQNSI
jgi:hypothetical protein